MWAFFSIQELSPYLTPYHNKYFHVSNLVFKANNDTESHILTGKFNSIPNLPFSIV